VLAALLDYQPAHILGATHRLPPGRQKTLLRIGARPIAKAREEIGIVFCRAVQLDPIESDRLIFETPRFNQVERTR